MPMRPNGSSLPTVSSHRLSGVTFSCSSVPSSFSRTMAIGAEHGRDDHQQQRQHAGHHEVLAEQLRVEPDADARRRSSRSRGAPGGRLAIASSAGASRRAASPAYASADGRPSSSRCRRRPPARSRAGLAPIVVAVPRRDRQGHPRPARSRCRAARRRRRRHVDDGEVRRALEAPDQVAALGDCGPRRATTSGTFLTSVVAA